ncbi:MAG: ROK family protein [Nocardioides sp.]
MSGNAEALKPDSASTPLYLGVDIGGTKVLAGVIATDGTVQRTARRSAPGRQVDVRVVENAVTDAVMAAAAGGPIAAVGVAAAGFVDADQRSVVFAPHLPWRGEDVRARLERRWAVPVVLDNDANAAAWAERTYGAARGATSALMVTLGTGIGGCLLINGWLHRGRNGMAGEFGHMQVVSDGRPCECGGVGCWEQYSSGNALVRFARHRIGREDTVLDAWCGGQGHRLSGPMVTRAALAGDQLARAAFSSVGKWLGVGLANLVAAFDPDRIVVGGGLSSAGDLVLAPARVALDESLVGAGHRVAPRVLAAALGPSAGMVGAATLARDALKNSTTPR